MRSIFKKALGAVQFFFRIYRNNWFAVPASAIAAVVSTVGAAAIMIAVSPVVHELLPNGRAIIANGIIAPLLAYVLYLSSYYLQMYRKERSSLFEESGQISPAKLKEWLRVVKYDYLAHVPSDTYLIACASLAQMLLESQGTPIFWAVMGSQFVDDLITFLKEPAIWGGAKEVVAWEKKENKTFLQKALAATKRGDQ